jgi:hypothetical protein
MTVGQWTSSVDIVYDVANRKGVAPTDLTPLYQAIDPDRLDGILDRDGERPTPVAVEFEYAGFDVRVQSDGTYTLG